MNEETRLYWEYHRGDLLVQGVNDRVYFMRFDNDTDGWRQVLVITRFQFGEMLECQLKGLPLSKKEDKKET